MLADIRLVGCAAGCEGAADALIDSLSRRIAAVKRRTDRLSAADRPRTVMIEWIDPLILAANWVPELLQLAGGACPLVTGGRHSCYTAWKEVREFDPQVILVSPCGFDLDRTVREARFLSGLEGWSDVDAVRNGRVLAVDGNAYVNRSGPRLVDTLEIIAHLLHPRLFPVPPTVSCPADAWCLI